MKTIACLIREEDMRATRELVRLAGSMLDSLAIVELPRDVRDHLRQARERLTDASFSLRAHVELGAEPVRVAVVGSSADRARCPSGEDCRVFPGCGDCPVGLPNPNGAEPASAPPVVPAPEPQSGDGASGGAGAEPPDVFHRKMRPLVDPAEHPTRASDANCCYAYWDIDDCDDEHPNGLVVGPFCGNERMLARHGGGAGACNGAKDCAFWQLRDCDDHAVETPAETVCLDFCGNCVSFTDSAPTGCSFGHGPENCGGGDRTFR